MIAGAEAQVADTANLLFAQMAGVYLHYWSTPCFEKGGSIFISRSWCWLNHVYCCVFCFFAQRRRTRIDPCAFLLNGVGSK